MADAAIASGLPQCEISFKGALQTLTNLLPALAGGVPSEAWRETLLNAIATYRVGSRPDRYEPRLLKRRPKQYQHLRQPRQNYRKRVAKTLYCGSQTRVANVATEITGNSE